MQITNWDKALTLRNIIIPERIGTHFTLHSEPETFNDDDLCSVSYSGYRTLSERRACNGRCHIDPEDLNDIEYQKINSGTAAQSRQQLSEDLCHPNLYHSFAPEDWQATLQLLFPLGFLENTRRELERRSKGVPKKICYFEDSNVIEMSNFIEKMIKNFKQLGLSSKFKDMIKSLRSSSAKVSKQKEKFTKEVERVFGNKSWFKRGPKNIYTKLKDVRDRVSPEDKQKIDELLKLGKLSKGSLDNNYKTISIQLALANIFLLKIEVT